MDEPIQSILILILYLLFLVASVCFSLRYKPKLVIVLLVCLLFLCGIIENLFWLLLFYADKEIGSVIGSLQIIDIFHAIDIISEFLLEMLIVSTLVFSNYYTKQGL